MALMGDVILQNQLSFSFFFFRSGLCFSSISAFGRFSSVLVFESFDSSRLWKI